MELLKKHFGKDKLAKLLGMELTEISPGYAKATMRVREDMHNAIGTLHGGATFALADFAFAAASNSHGTVSVAINASIAFTKGVREGLLTAEAREAAGGSKIATYDVKVTDESGDVVALFQGTVYRKKESITDYTQE